METPGSGSAGKPNGHFTNHLNERISGEAPHYNNLNGRHRNGHDKLSYTPLREEPPALTIAPNDQLEQLLLAALLRDNDRLNDIGALTAEHFGRDVHSRIFGLMQTLASHGLPATAQTMHWLIKDDPALASQGDYLTALLASSVSYTPHAVQHYAQQLITLHCRRRLVELINDVPRILELKDWDYVGKTDALRSEFDGIFSDWQRAVQPSSKSLAALDFANLPDDPQISRSWLVPDWLPMLETCAIGGAGGEGKTLLAQQLATAAALGSREWLGLPVTTMKAACVLCEDRHDDAYWRQAKINRLYRCSMADLEGRLKIYPRRDAASNHLATFDNAGELQLSQFFRQLLAELKQFGAQLVVLDTLADMFVGDQNSYFHARKFVRGVCDLIARELNGVVVLLYHPSRTGQSQGDLQSGSVQWDAAFRSRIVLTRPRGEDKEDDDTSDTRMLSLVKANLGPTQDGFKITWTDGVFVRKPEATDATEAPAYQRGAELSKWCRVFLQLLAQYQHQGRPVSASPAARNFAPAMFAADPDREGCTKQQLDRAMGALFKSGQLANQQSRGSKVAQLIATGGQSDG